MLPLVNLFISSKNTSLFLFFLSLVKKLYPKRVFSLIKINLLNSSESSISKTVIKKLTFLKFH